MNKTMNGFNYLVNLFCLVMLASGFGIFLGGVTRTVGQLSPDLYWQAVGAGLSIAALVSYCGGKRYGFVKDTSQFLIVVATLCIGTVGLPVVVSVMLTPKEISNINPAIFYWGLPVGALLTTASAGSALVSWKSG